MSHSELKEYDSILNEHGNEWDMLAWASGQKVTGAQLSCLVDSPLCRRYRSICRAPRSCPS